MRIVLVNPEIPQNTGNVVRTCSVTGTSLSLVPPLGFSIQDRWLKRSGMDYWDEVDIEVNRNLDEVIEKGKNFYFFSSHGDKNYTEIEFSKEDILIFGSETKGLDKTLWEQYPEHFYTIPMLPQKRCLNLATSVGIVLYEGLRQNDFFINDFQ